MWILPKQLHTSAFVPDTAALSLDLNESSQLCAQSLFVRSKPSQLRTWLLKWKRDSWTQHLSGRILKPSHGKAFETAWTSSLAATLASHSVAQASALEPTTQDIFGPTSQAEFAFSSPKSASSRTSRDTLRWDSPQSSAIWKNWVTKCRGEYLVRLKSAHLTSENACSSWPTATTRDWKDTGDMSKSMIRKDGKKRMDTLGRVAQANPSTHGSRLESWPTPDTNNHRDGTTLRTDNNLQQGGFHGVSLHHAVESPLSPHAKAWATPQTRDSRSGGADRWDSPERSRNLNDQIAATTAQNARLNPRWVETLMGLPVGWTMPSCQYPVTTALTSCGSLATE